MIWQIRDMDPDTKARIKARAAIHNKSIADELTDMEAAVTNIERAMAASPETFKPHAQHPLEVSPKAHNYAPDDQ